MRKATLAAAAALLGTGAVQAQDGSSFVPNWAGAYIGGAAGLSIGHVADHDPIVVQRIQTVTPPLPTPPSEGGLAIFLDTDHVIASRSRTINGSTYGGYFGHNWQQGRLVYGVEASLSGSSMGKTWEQAEPIPTVETPPTPVINALDANANTYDITHDVNWFGSVAGRLGVADGRYLLYGIAGVVWGNDTTSIASWSGSDLIDYRKDSSTNTGWLLGMGLEYAVSECLSARVEYNHVDLGSSDRFDGRDRVSVSFDTVKFGASMKVNGFGGLTGLQ